MQHKRLPDEDVKLRCRVESIADSAEQERRRQLKITFSAEGELVAVTGSVPCDRRGKWIGCPGANQETLPDGPEFERLLDEGTSAT